MNLYLVYLQYVSTMIISVWTSWSLFGLSGYAQIGNSSSTVEELFNDTERLSYIRDYLTYLSFAIR